MLLVGDVHRQIYRGFKFESFWPKIPGYLEVMQNAWGQHTGVCNAFLNLHIKMQKTAKCFKKWSREKIGKGKIMMLAAKKHIAILEITQEHRKLTEQEIVFKQELKQRLLGLAAVEKLRLR